MLLIENTEPNLKSFGTARQPTGVDLKPGINEVDPADWTEAKQHPVVQHWIKSKAVRLVGAKALEKLPRASAIDVVQNTLDIELLRKWEKAPLDKAVAQAVRAQLQEMTTLPEPTTVVEG